MAVHASKKRKTEHIPSSDEEDNVSFASFGDDGSDAEMSGVEGEAQSGAEEEDMMDGSEEEDDNEEEMPAKAVVKEKKNKKATKTPSIPPPTASQLASASGFKSNVFKLQSDELLQQIRPKQAGKREKAAETALHLIKQSVEKIPANGPFLVAEAERHLLRTKVAVPFPTPRPAADAQYKFAYAKPANINVVGSFALKTSSRTQEWLEIDMVVVMPASLFEDKDYLNYRYFYKRAYYLASIAAGLKSNHKGDFSLKFAQHHGNPLKPVLVVSPAQPTGKDQAPLPKWRINIIPCVAPDRFPAEKLKLDKNCVRSEDQNTPFYNSSLRSDMLLTSYLKTLHTASKSCESYTDACLLGSTWLRQRAFASSAEMGGFGNFEWNALMALCLQGGGPGGKPLLSSGYSSYQLFKATLQLLAMKDFLKHPLSIGVSDIPKALDGTPIVWDAARNHNLLYKVSQSSYRLLRNEAKLTLIALGDQIHDGFDATFILRVDQPLYRFDYTVELPERLISSSDNHDHHSGAHLSKLYDTLKRGLGDRVTQIAVFKPTLDSWSLGSSRPTSKGNISIGLSVNPDTVKRLVDHGPAAENKSEAASFRSFWGDKSELRRFKDGSILESLIWSSPAESGGQSVLEQILGVLLNRHFGVPTMEDITFHGDNFTKLLRGGTDISLFAPMMERYRQFENDIRELRDLPLSIRQIMPADPQLCYSSTSPPGGNNTLPIPADVVLQFEGSGRWPDDLIAIQRTKIAFLLMISQMLQSAHTGLTTRIGLENESHPIFNQAFLDVTYDLSATFRLRIYHDREQHLLQSTLSSKTSDPKSRELAALGLATYRKEFLLRPSQTQALIRLSTRFPALSGAIRLLKKWFASHYLSSNHFPPSLIELLVVRTFTNPSPYGVPTTPHTAFLRTLSWISRWDWRNDPLIVDFSTERSELLTEKAARTIRTNFEAWRKLDPGMNRVAIFAGSSIDPDGVGWTEGGKPGKVLAGRMTALARAAVAEIGEKGLRIEPQALFSSPLEDFDFVLHLSSSSSPSSGVAGKKSSKQGGFKNLEMHTNGTDDVEKIGYSPYDSLLAELEEVYSSAVLFFQGEGVIAGLFHPNTRVEGGRGWKVNLAFSTIPVVRNGGEEEAVEARINREGMIGEMGRLGGDLVRRVEILK